MSLLDLILRRRSGRNGASSAGRGAGKRRQSRHNGKAAKRHFFRGLASPAFLTGVAVWFFSTGTLVFGPIQPAHNWVIGESAEQYIYAEVPFTYTDLAETHRRRRLAADSVPPVYRISPEQTAAILESYDAFCGLLRSMADDIDDSSPAEWTELPDAAVQHAHSLPTRDRQALASLLANSNRTDVLRRLLAEELRGGIATREVLPDFQRKAVGGEISLMDPLLRTSRSSVDTLAEPEQVVERVLEHYTRLFGGERPRHVAILRGVLPKLMVSNLVFDRAATEKAQALAAEQIPQVKETVEAGTVLVRAGQTVNAHDLRLLRKHTEAVQEARDLSSRGRDPLFYALVCALLVLASAYAVYAAAPGLCAWNSNVVLLGVVLILQLIVNRAVAHTVLATWTAGSAAYYMYAILPFALAPMLLAQLCGIRTALLGSAYLATLTCLRFDGSMQILLAAFLAGVTGSILMQRARRRYHAIRAGLAAGAAVLVVGLAFLLRDPLPWGTLQALVPRAALLSLAAGVVTSTVASAILPLFEFTFGITTDISLLELSDLNHPLLKRLQFEAPGSYHHSLVVATLAEQASTAIGANPLLARVCAYFHDIGKLEHPQYFTENSSGRDYHRELQPRMSTMVILNHVRVGFNLAQKYKLKRPIREAIAQHHGTSLVYYFYHKNRKQGEKVARRTAIPEDHEQNQFRYPGPKPQRKEIVILAIADVAEAASRSLEKPTPQKIAALVNDLVLRRFRDGQFEEAQLTFQELNTVKETIIKSLATMLHGRIKYPGEEDEDANSTEQTVPDAQVHQPSTADADRAASIGAVSAQRTE